MTQRETLKPRPSQTTGFAQTPFDASVERLPANYKGHDATRIITILRDKKEKAKKGEFETTAGYEKRLQQRDTRLYGELTEDSPLAFVAEMDESSGYDADAQKLRSRVNSFIDQDRLVVRLADKTKERTYIATNVFGANTAVTELRGDRYGISIKNARTLDSFQVSMDVPTAQAIKARVKPLVVCQPTGDLLDVTLLLSRPTRNIPIDSEVLSYYLNVNVIAIWLIDPQSGRVYHREEIRP